MNAPLSPTTLLRCLPWQALLLLGFLSVAHVTRAQQLYALDTSASANPAGQPAAAEVAVAQLVGFYRPAGADAADTTTATIPVILTEMVVARLAYDAPGVMLRWTTAGERRNAGFIIERRTEAEAIFHRVAQVPGQGTSAQIHRYAFADDDNREPKTTYYRLRQLDSEGLPSTYSLEYEVVGLPVGLPLPEDDPVANQSRKAPAETSAGSAARITE